jgi:DNA-directed RNA polymerase alpha subunit
MAMDQDGVPFQARPSLARNEAIVAARNRGRTYRDIGLEHGITKERVRQILCRAERAAAARERQARWLASEEHRRIEEECRRIEEEVRATVSEFPIDKLELTVRAWNCLRNDDCLTVGELLTRTESDLMRIRNFGRKSLRDVRNALALAGFPPLSKGCCG